jgi:integrase
MKKSILNEILTRLNTTHPNHSKWLLCKESNGFSIKRTAILVDGKRTFQRLPVELYKAFRNNEGLMDELIRRLNHEKSKEAEKAFIAHKIKEAYISQELLEEFRDTLRKSESNQNMRWVLDHFIGFFAKISPDPQDWYKKKNQNVWADYLLGLKYAPIVVRKIINISNRLMKFLHSHRTLELPLLIFQPIDKYTFAEWTENHRINGGGKASRNYIPPEEFAVIETNLPEDIRSVILLCYKYGLRRSEALGLWNNLNVVRHDFIIIDRQANSVKDGIVSIKPTKSRKERHVNHWFSSPEECYTLIVNICPIHMHNITKKFTSLTAKLFREGRISKKYVVHDLRHTWISRALQNHNLNDVSQAAGHTDISTTNDYIHDTRKLNDKPWKPSTSKKSA